MAERMHKLRKGNTQRLAGGDEESWTQLHSSAGYLEGVTGLLMDEVAAVIGDRVASKG